ncbi:MAG TPA: PhzF family phenazine biosynthesis protein [Rhodothermales bacterium]|nr:PhzF family phenazine biosynthesis protein [Rhodothermales bacterium]
MRFVQVDAFTDRPFAGNPAAVMLLDAPRDDAWLQAVAREHNLSETAFLWPREDRAYDLRWFAPACEINLCGHATLASAHVLWTEGHLRPDEEAVFHTRSGILRCRLDGAQIELNFPARPVVSADAPDGLEAALGAAPVFVGRGGEDLFVRLENAATVRGLDPNLTAIARLKVRGVIVTAPGDDEAALAVGSDVVSRFFAPGAGVPEDPVTGSAHCAIGPYWAEALGKPVLRCEQASLRGGLLEVEPRGERVLLRGQAVTVLEGRLLV